MPPTPLTDKAPWNDYAKRVAELFPPLGSGDGVDEVEIVAAETNLESRLPGVLREFYLLAGRRQDVNRSFCRLRPPGDLIVGPDALYFYEDPRGKVRWGIPFADYGVPDFNYNGDNPPVVRDEGHEPPQFHPDHDRLSSFLVTILYWQAVNGGMPFRGCAPIDETEIPAVHRHWPKVELLGSLWEHLMVFHRAGQVVCIEGRSPDLRLHAASRTRADFQDITDRLGLLWETTSFTAEINPG